MVLDGAQRMLVGQFSPWISVVIKRLNWLLELFVDERRLSCIAD